VVREDLLDARMQTWYASREYAELMARQDKERNTLHPLPIREAAGAAALSGTTEQL
jgi:hypothetical protein